VSSLVHRRKGLLALSVGVGLSVLTELIEEEVEDLVATRPRACGRGPDLAGLELLKGGRRRIGVMAAHHVKLDPRLADREVAFAQFGSPFAHSASSAIGS
jgi:hypothetical protein